MRRLLLVALLPLACEVTLRDAAQDQVREIAHEEAIRVANQWIGHHEETMHGVPAPTGPPPPTGPTGPTGPPPPGGTGDDPCGTLDPFHGSYVGGGWWEGFWTKSRSKLSEQGPLGINSERNATIAAIAAIEGHDDCDRYYTQGRVRFEVTVNGDGLEPGGGGKHLVNIANNALSAADRTLQTSRAEIDNPGTQPRFVVHMRPGSAGGPSYSAALGSLPISFAPDRPVSIDWTWNCDGPRLTMTCCGGPNTREYTHTMPDGYDCIGRYWSSGHMETISGGGKMTFSRPTFSRN